MFDAGISKEVLCPHDELSGITSFYYGDIMSANLLVKDYLQSFIWTQRTFPKPVPPVPGEMLLDKLINLLK